MIGCVHYSVLTAKKLFADNKTARPYVMCAVRHTPLNRHANCCYPNFSPACNCYMRDAPALLFLWINHLANIKTQQLVWSSENARIASELRNTLAQEPELWKMLEEAVDYYWQLGLNSLTDAQEVQSSIDEKVTDMEEKLRSLSFILLGQERDRGVREPFVIPHDSLQLLTKALPSPRNNSSS
ncbi:hypothetical protein Pelo_2192 [Pelomyxa schiedti]|nr:hypothetical protein Pelo_2192 [Pelomyxa schiedti]